MLGPGVVRGAKERKFLIDNLIVRIQLIIETILVRRPCALRVINSLFQVAFYLPSYRGETLRRRGCRRRGLLCWRWSHCRQTPRLVSLFCRESPLPPHLLCLFCLLPQLLTPEVYRIQLGYDMDWQNTEILSE